MIHILSGTLSSGLCANYEGFCFYVSLCNVCCVLLRSLFFSKERQEGSEARVKGMWGEDRKSRERDTTVRIQCMVK